MPLSIFGWRLKGPVMPEPLTKGVVSGGKEIRKVQRREGKEWRYSYLWPGGTIGDPKWKGFSMTDALSPRYPDRRTQGEHRKY